MKIKTIHDQMEIELSRSSIEVSATAFHDRDVFRIYYNPGMKLEIDEKKGIIHLIMSEKQ